MSNNLDRDIDVLWNSELVCCLVGIHLRSDGVVVLRLMDGHCTDMSGAIRVAESVVKPMPGFKLKAVATIGGRREFAVYVKVVDDKTDSIQIGKSRWVVWSDDQFMGARQMPKELADLISAYTSTEARN
jgi:hypothetical protein